MPYKSIAQERYFNANKGKLEAQGVDVNEWNASSKGKDLPMKASSMLDPEKHAPKKKNA